MNKYKDERYIERDKIKHKELIDKYNVYVSGTVNNHSGQFNSQGKHKVLGNLGIINKGEACSNTYFTLGSFDDINEAENLLKYLRCKFTRCIIDECNNTISMNSTVFRDVPLQDFTSKSDINWGVNICDIDKQLYKKYELTDDEVDFIERNIDYK